MWDPCTLVTPQNWKIQGRVEVFILEVETHNPHMRVADLFPAQISKLLSPKTRLLSAPLLKV